MRVMIGVTQLEDHETAQLEAALEDRLSALAKAAKKCGQLALHAGEREAVDGIDVCHHLLELLSPDGYHRETVRRTQQDMFSAAPNGSEAAPVG